MIVWQIQDLAACGVGQLTSGAAYFATKAEAKARLVEYQGLTGIVCEGPIRIAIHNRADLAEQLNNATGFGGT